MDPTMISTYIAAWNILCALFVIRSTTSLKQLIAHFTSVDKISIKPAVVARNKRVIPREVLVDNVGSLSKKESIPNFGIFWLLA